MRKFSSNTICSVPGCTNRTTPKIGLHKFPDNEVLKNAWRLKCKMKQVSKHSKCCSEHFVATDFKGYFDLSEKKPRNLYSFAVPSQKLPQTSTSSNFQSKPSSVEQSTTANIQLNLNVSNEQNQTSNFDATKISTNNADDNIEVDPFDEDQFYSFMDQKKSSHTPGLRCCGVPACKTLKAKNIHMFSIPKSVKDDPQELQKWTDILKMGRVFPKNFVICSRHFRENEILIPKHREGVQLHARLVSGAVPSQNLPDKVFVSANTLRYMERLRNKMFENKVRENKNDALDEIADHSSNSGEVNSNQEQYNNLGIFHNYSLPSMFENMDTTTQSNTTLKELQYDIKIQDIFETSTAKTTFTSNIEDSLKIPGTNQLFTPEFLQSWTGIPNCFVLELIVAKVKAIKSCEQQLMKIKMSIEQLIVLVFIKFKVNLSFKQMAPLFHLSSNKVFLYFNTFLPILKTALEPLMFRPDENCRNKMPQFVNCRSSECIKLQFDKPSFSFAEILSNRKGMEYAKTQISVNSAGLITHASISYADGISAKSKIIFLSSDIGEQYDDNVVMVDKSCTDTNFSVQKGKSSQTDDCHKDVTVPPKMIQDPVIHLVKQFKLLSDRMDTLVRPQIETIIIVICCMINLGKPFFNHNKL